MTGPEQRAKHITNLRKIADSYQNRAQRELDRPKLCDRSPGFPTVYNQLADMWLALLWAIGYVERHVNLETGELTIPLDEPEEAA